MSTATRRCSGIMVLFGVAVMGQHIGHAKDGKTKVVLSACLSRRQCGMQILDATLV